ncbi:hypothetical protein Rsub_12947 [Raphidocelis subcapitata]|uniref:Uncharacterized protein n=1 Tax=Raphidocelis subcapitata TaxID=307507 RepID=A0A2V0PLA0_9CHLO|nr:hypothetical protein Rsub_12947 [Raphidocelis subcapitata]|eukprot:GBF99832.1 hypothetical protein Rsub_12947 [Raphidocelis subcapitata]
MARLGLFPVLLALAALAALAAPARAEHCALSLEESELNRLGAALAANPSAYLEIDASGAVKGAKVDALRADGYSQAAIDCMVSTYGAAPAGAAVQGGGGAQPLAVGVTKYQRKMTLSWFKDRGNEAKWKRPAESRFGLGALLNLDNKKMYKALKKMDSSKYPSTMAWMGDAVGVVMGPQFAILAPIVAFIMQGAMGAIPPLPPDY